jgi:hypothetical protein
MVYLACGLSFLSLEVHCRLVPTLMAVSFSVIFGALLTKTYVQPAFASPFSLLRWLLMRVSFL